MIKIRIPFALLCLLPFTLAAQTSPWQTTSSLNTPRAGAAVVQHNDKVYVLGGIDGGDFLKTTESSRFSKAGHLEPWQHSSPLNEPRGFFAAAAHNNWVYAVAGGNGPNGHNLLRSVERARINEDGSLSTWTQEEHALNIPRRCVKVTIMNGYLYAFGGFGGTLLNTVERAKINADGSLGPWHIEPQRLAIPRYVHALKQVDGKLLMMGGHEEKGGRGSAHVSISSLNEHNHFKSWQASQPLNAGRYGLTAAANDNFIYAIGGLNGATYLDNIEYLPTSGDLTKQQWKATLPLSSPRGNMAVAQYQNRLYIIGGANKQGYYDSVEYIQISDNGELTAASNASTENNPAPAARNTIALPHGGVVEESVHSGIYTYIRVTTPEGKEEWIATSHAEHAPGVFIRYSNGVMMQNFFSRSLQREFPLIRFVSNTQEMH